MLQGWGWEGCQHSPEITWELHEITQDLGQAKVVLPGRARYRPLGSCLSASWAHRSALGCPVHSLGTTSICHNDICIKKNSSSASTRGPGGIEFEKGASGHPLNQECTIHMVCSQPQCYKGILHILWALRGLSSCHSPTPPHPQSLHSQATAAPGSLSLQSCIVEKPVHSVQRHFMTPVCNFISFYYLAQATDLVWKRLHSIERERDWQSTMNNILSNSCLSNMYISKMLFCLAYLLITYFLELKTHERTKH